MTDQIKIAAREANIASKQIKVLCVDDEVINLDILEKHLQKAGYETMRAIDGQVALDILAIPDNDIDVVLLDQMMPNVDGLEVLRQMKSNPRLEHIPVIMQTALAGADDAVEGLDSGAYYYITKPYEAQVLLSVVDSAVREVREKSQLQTRANKVDAVLSHATTGEFKFKTQKEGREVATFLANFAVNPSKAIVSITALIVNAIEHGNLEIGYDLKNQLMREGGYSAEFQRRLSAPEYSSRFVVVSFNKGDGVVKIRIKDCGRGFKWRDFIEFDPSRISEPNGGGVALANSTSNNMIDYIGDGSEVHLIIQAK